MTKDLMPRVSVYPCLSAKHPCAGRIQLVKLYMVTLINLFLLVAPRPSDPLSLHKRDTQPSGCQVNTGLGDNLVVGLHFPKPQRGLGQRC